MKIADLKQPYRRMAEYLAEENTDESKGVIYLNSAFEWSLTNGSFWVDVDCGEHPRITEEIKKHFPPGFDFSGEEVKNKPVMQMLDTETQKTIYTQLVKEGKFDELPDTCEFSEAVELEVWDFESVKDNRMIVGKFKNLFMAVTKIDNEDYRIFKYAQLPTPKIDFSQLKSGDVVEVEYYGDEGDDNIVGYIYQLNDYSIRISSKMSYLNGYEIILKQNIKSITKIK